MLPEKGNPYLKCLDWACGHCEAFWKSCILFFMESSAWVISTLIQPLEKGCWDTLWLRHSLSLLPVCGCWRSWGGGELSQSCTSGLRESLGLNQGFPCPSLIQEPLTPCGNWRFTDLPNHWSWKRPLENIQSKSLFQAGSLQQVPQVHVQLGFCVSPQMEAA